MHIGVDIGYGQTKAISEKGEKVVFPSLVAPMTKGPLQDNTQHKARIQCASVSMKEVFVGESARYSKTIHQLSGQEKPAEIHDILLLTAIGLLVGRR
jgi:plasmid segregation protein ParM